MKFVQMLLEDIFLDRFEDGERVQELKLFHMEIFYFGSDVLWKLLKGAIKY